MALQLENLRVNRGVALPKVKRASSQRDPKDNPLYPLMVESNKILNDGQPDAAERAGMEIPDVPAGSVRELLNLIRYAAIDLKVGSRIVLVSAQDGNTELKMGKKEEGHEVLNKATDEDWTGPVTVKFSAAKQKTHLFKIRENKTAGLFEVIWVADGTVIQTAPTKDEAVKLAGIARRAANGDTAPAVIPDPVPASVESEPTPEPTPSNSKGTRRK